MSKMRNRLMLGVGTACVLSVCAAVATPARADTNDGLLDLLKAKGAITQAEYDTIKARQKADAKADEKRVKAAEAKAHEAEARAHEAEAKAHEAEAKAAAQSTGSEAALRDETLRAADLSAPVMPIKAPVQYVTVLKDCVGIRVGAVDICTSGDISFFGIEDFPDKRRPAAIVTGGLASVSDTNSAAIRAGLLPSSFQFDMKTHQAGLDIGVHMGIYVGGNNVGPWGVLGANSGGAPFSLGTPGIDFRQVYMTLGTPTFGTFKIGRDIGIFASDAILNDLTLLGSGTPAGNAAPGNTTLGRIGIGYLYTDFVPQVSYKSPNFNGFTFAGGIFTPYSQLPTDPESGAMNGHDLPGIQGQLKYVGKWGPDTGITLSVSGVAQRHTTDCFSGGSSCAALGAPAVPLAGEPAANPLEIPPGTSFWAGAIDGFGKLDIAGFSFVAYGYTGQGVGTTGLYINGVDDEGNTRRSYGGYLQASYTFYNTFTLGGSYGASWLNTANANDLTEITAECAAGIACLVSRNESWIGFARYKLTDWVKLQAEYVHTRAVNQVGGDNRDDAILAGTTLFW